MKDKWGEQRVIEKAVDVVIEVARRQVNPFSYLYHNPNRIHTMQYFAHWAQRWTEHKLYKLLMRVAQITGYEPVPYWLTYRHAKRDGYSDRRVRCGSLVFYLLKPEEMSPGLRRRYEQFRNLLKEELHKDAQNWEPETSQNTGG